MATKRVTTEKKTSAPKRVRSTKPKTSVEGEIEPAEGSEPHAFMRFDHETVAQRAYELFQARGMTHGRDVDDWLAAERELEQR
jgi:hypothetical protein